MTLGFLVCIAMAFISVLWLAYCLPHNKWAAAVTVFTVVLWLCNAWNVWWAA